MASRRRPHRGFPPKRGVSTLGGNGLEASDGSSNRSLFSRRAGGGPGEEGWGDGGSKLRPFPVRKALGRAAVDLQTFHVTVRIWLRGDAPIGGSPRNGASLHWVATVLRPPTVRQIAPSSPGGRRGSDLTNRRRPQDRCH